VQSMCGHCWLMVGLLVSFLAPGRAGNLDMATPMCARIRLNDVTMKVAAERVCIHPGHSCTHVWETCILVRSPIKEAMHVYTLMWNGVDSMSWKIVTS
jgi:hypothetical protein